MEVENSFDISSARKSLLLNGFTIVPILNKNVIERIKDIIKLFIVEDQSYYDSLPRTHWHELILEIQNKINDEELLTELISNQEILIKQIIDTEAEKLGWVDVLKLRAVRPFKEGIAPDHVPFHRETFYAVSKQVRFQYNYWTPVSFAASSSGIRYIPKSHMILDEFIKVDVDNEHYAKVKRFSAGHSIGYPYMPKVISNFDKLTNEKDKLLSVPKGHSVLFSAMLIHGNGVNKNNQTRFSVDTGFIPANNILKNKPLFAAKNNMHYRVR